MHAFLLPGRKAILARCPGSDAPGTHDAEQNNFMTCSSGLTEKEVFEYRTFTRLKQLEYLIRTQQIDPQFLWTNAGV